MKHLYKFLSVMLIIAFIFSLAGCKPQDIVSDTNSIVSNFDNSSEITSTEDISSTEGISSEETSSDEDKTSSGDKVSSNISSNTSSKTASSGNSTSSKPSSNTSSIVSKPTTNTSSTVSKPSQNTSSTKPMSWKEEMEAYGFEVFYDENVKLYYRVISNNERVYESKYDGVNITKEDEYSNWDPVLKMYYTTDGTVTMSWYDGGWHGNTDHPFWNEKYRNGYWKIDYKRYTDGTSVVLREYEYDEDTSYDSSLCEYCGKKRGNGTNNTCSISFRWHEDWRCVICGTIVAKYHCHSCPDEYHSDLIGGYRESLN